jgi:hypothetical protein
VSFGENDAVGWQNEGAGGQPLEGHKVAVLGYLSSVNDAKVVVEVNKVKRREGSCDREAREAGNPDSSFVGRGDPFQEDLEDLDRLDDGVDHRDSGGERPLAGLAERTEESGVHGPSSQR